MDKQRIKLFRKEIVIILCLISGGLSILSIARIIEDCQIYIGITCLIIGALEYIGRTEEDDQKRLFFRSYFAFSVIGILNVISAIYSTY